MSSTTTTATPPSAMDRQTYWCHECDMSVSLLSSATTTSSSLLCPHCHSDFLEQMDSPSALFQPNTHSESDPTINESQFPDSFLHPSFSISAGNSSSAPALINFPTAATAPASDDNYLLDSPYLRRLIHLSNPESDNQSATCLRHHSPASRSAIEAIPTIKITPLLVDLDQIILCAVCKDQFAIDTEAKQLPCKHLYHSDCILPWLSQQNTCPVCRFQLPTETPDLSSRRFEEVVFGELMMEDQNLLEFESTLRHIARRHGLRIPLRNSTSVMEESLSVLSPTQVGEAAMGLVERADSLETVSSWPSWPVVQVRNRAEDGGGDDDISVSSRLGEGSDAVIPST